MTEPVTRGRVLVIDDHRRTRYVLRRILITAGYSVEEAETAGEGLTKASSSPDIIIADVNLPDMLGYDLCRRLKANSQTAAIPVLQISASFISDESKVQALQGGADSYLTQPVEPTVLLAQVQALLRLKRAEALSGLSARHWQTTFDSLTDGLALVGSNGVVLRVNRAFLRMLQLTHSAAEGQLVANIFETSFGIPFAEYLAHRAKGQPTELPYFASWFRIRYDEVHGDPQQDSGAILLLADMTEHKKLQETLKMSERMAATGRLAHIIAHEINNPLEAMSNLLYLIQQDPSLGEDGRSYVSQASAELDRISQITKQILAFHRESKVPIPARADEIVSGVLAMFRARMLSSGIELNMRLDCSKLIEVHPGEIRQAFGNLIANALDAIGGGGGTLRVRCFDAVDQVTSRKGVRFVFSDSGAGIPEQVLPHIFGAFYTTKEMQGSGVGLWLTSEVVTKHGGRIRVRSRSKGPYRGTVFDVFLPFISDATRQQDHLRAR